MAKSPNCEHRDEKDRGIMKNPGTRDVVRDARPGENGKDDTGKKGKCTYPCYIECDCAGQPVTVEVSGPLNKIPDGDPCSDETGGYLN